MERFKRISLLFTAFIIVIIYPVAGQNEELAEYLAERINPLEDPDDLSVLVDRAGSGRVVLLGESTHGTSEFYRWRYEITRRLIEEKGFSFIAVEGDWAAIYRLNQYVKGMPGAPASARRVLRSFNRWPEWMWANRDIEELAEWMREHNSSLPDELKAGFYGIDVYGQWESVDVLLDYAAKKLPGHHGKIRDKLACFTNYRDEWAYARAVAERRHPSCVVELQEVVSLLEEHSTELKELDREKFLRARQNALVIQNAEEFYRLAVRDNNASWNSRAKHMWETVSSLLDKYGEGSAGVVWAHNTHVGDAGATAMRFQDLVNIGSMSRAGLGGENVFILGFGTYEGRVNAGMRWGEPMQIMRIPPGIPGSIEHLMGRLQKDRFYLLFNEDDRNHPLLSRFIGHRAIGVVYDPENEAGNYVPTVLPLRYDAFIFIRNTGPLRPVR